MSELTNNDETFQRIRSEIAHDMRPVRRLSSGWLRALFVLPYALLALVLLLLVTGLRSDSQDLGLEVLWGLGFLQLLSAYLIFSVALRQAVPGDAVNPKFWLASPALALLVPMVVAIWTYMESPLEIPAERVLGYGLACFSLTSLLGVLPLVIGLWLLSRGLPLRPRVAGLLTGLGGGLLAEAVYRMHCPYSHLSHVLPWHGGAVLLLGLVGFCSGVLWENRRLRQWQDQHRSLRY
jgi:hypothetical protein